MILCEISANFRILTMWIEVVHCLNWKWRFGGHFCRVMRDLWVLPSALGDVGSKPEPQSPSDRKLHEDRSVNSFCQQKVARVRRFFFLFNLQLIRWLCILSLAQTRFYWICQGKLMIKLWAESEFICSLKKKQSCLIFRTLLLPCIDCVCSPLKEVAWQWCHCLRGHSNIAFARNKQQSLAKQGRVHFKPLPLLTDALDPSCWSNYPASDDWKDEEVLLGTTQSEISLLQRRMETGQASHQTARPWSWMI